METNEQGLTKEEKIMFFILGLILLVAIGVLIIDGFSKNDKSLNNETPVQEVEAGEENQSSEEETNSLKEAVEVDSKETQQETEKSDSSETNDNKGETNITPEESKTSEDKKSDEETKSNETEEQKNNEGKKKLPYTAADDFSGKEKQVEAWSFNREVVTEAYTGTRIHINKNVVLENGVMEEAVVTVRKVIGNRLVIIDTDNDEFIAEYGTYIYSYTHNNITKEITLKVYNNLEVENVDILGLKETVDEQANISENTFINLSNNNKNANVSLEDNIYTITAINNKKSNEVAIKMTLNTISNRITSQTRGVKVLEPSTYHEELNNKEIILLINLDILSKDNTNIITLKVDGTEYIFKLNVKLTDKKENNSDTNTTKQPVVENKPIQEEPPVIPEGPTKTSNNNIQYHIVSLNKVFSTKEVLVEFP